LLSLGDFGGLQALLALLQLNGDTPEELSPWVLSLVSRVSIIRKLTSFAAYKLDRLAVPVFGKVEGNSSWEPERQFRVEFKKTITEICRNEILMSTGPTRVNP
jgi:hypothetical protein